MTSFLHFSELPPCSHATDSIARAVFTVRTISLALAGVRAQISFPPMCNRCGFLLDGIYYQKVMDMCHTSEFDSRSSLSVISLSGCANPSIEPVEFGYSPGADSVSCGRSSASSSCSKMRSQFRMFALVATILALSGSVVLGGSVFEGSQQEVDVKVSSPSIFR